MPASWFELLRFVNCAFSRGVHDALSPLEMHTYVVYFPRRGW